MLRPINLGHVTSFSHVPNKSVCQCINVNVVSQKSQTHLLTNKHPHTHAHTHIREAHTV